MGEFLAVEAQLAKQSTEMRAMIGWVRKALCKYKTAQNVVGHRIHAPGQTVTAAMAADPFDVR